MEVTPFFLIDIISLANINDNNDVEDGPAHPSRGGKKLGGPAMEL
jgi:hypothetical protein